MYVLTYVCTYVRLNLHSKYIKGNTNLYSLLVVLTIRADLCTVCIGGDRSRSTSVLFRSTYVRTNQVLTIQGMYGCTKPGTGTY